MHVRSLILLAGLGLVLGVFLWKHASHRLTQLKSRSASRPIASDSLEVQLPTPRSRPTPNNQSVIAQQSSQNRIQVRKAREQLIRWVKRGLTQAGGDIKISKTAYKWHSELRAIETHKFNPKLGRVVETKGKYVIYKPHSEPSGEDRLVVINKERSALGVLTGRFIVNVRDHRKMAQLSQDYALPLDRSFDHLNLGFFGGEKNQLSELQSVVERLRQDERVVRADLEVFETSLISQ